MLILKALIVNMKVKMAMEIRQGKHQLCLTPKAGQKGLNGNT